MRQPFPAVFRSPTVLAALVVFTVAPAGAAPPSAKDYAEFTGRTEAAEDVQITPRVAGTLAKIAFQEGSRVTQGQLLFELDARSYQVAMEQARAKLAQGKAELEAVQVNVERSRRLAATAAVSQADIDKAIAQVTDKAAAVKWAEADVNLAEINLNATRIASPIGGRAGRAALSAGNWAQPSTVLTTVVSEDPIYVSFAVPEREYLQLARQWRRDGREVRVKELRIPVEVGLSDEQGFPHKGVLEFIDNQADPKTGTIRFRAVLPNPDRLMIPGLFARVRMPLTH